MPGVEVHTGVKRSTVYAKVKDGTFPPPIQLGPRAVGWKLSVLNAWLASRPVGIATEPAGPRKRRAAKTGE
jgi:prophage regulatory protein